MLTLIVARARNGVIGADGALTKVEERHANAYKEVLARVNAKARPTSTTKATPSAINTGRSKRLRNSKRMADTHLPLNAEQPQHHA